MDGALVAGLIREPSKVGKVGIVDVLCDDRIFRISFVYVGFPKSAAVIPDIVAVVSSVALVPGGHFPLRFRGQVELEAVAGLLAHLAEEAVGVDSAVGVGRPGHPVLGAAQVFIFHLNPGKLAGAG